MTNKLIHTEGRIVVKVDVESKNSHTFQDGIKIRLERKYDNFNQRYTQPVNAIVVSAETIPGGSEILIHHNACHDTNKIFNYVPLSGKETGGDIKYFSIREDEAFAWLDKTEWHPLPGFDFALRVFKPYNGILQGIEPTLIKNVLYITTGHYKGLVCHTLMASDYEIIFQDVNGREGNLIRVRTSEDKKAQREEEISVIDHSLTEQVLNRELLVGITIKDAKPLIQLING